MLQVENAGRILREATLICLIHEAICHILIEITYICVPYSKQCVWILIS